MKSDEVSNHDQADESNRPPSLHRARWLLAVSVLVYLGLAAASIYWKAEQPILAIVLVFFAGHSAAYLLHSFVRGDIEG